MKYTIFVERAFDPDTFEKLVEFIELKGPSKCHLYCTTPANYDLFRAEQGYQGTRQEVSDELAHVYKILQHMGCEIHLHLHLSLRPEKMDQQPLFDEAVAWMRSNGFECMDISYGWYLSSDQSRKLEYKHGLRWMKGKWTYDIHDYELQGNIWHPVMILQNVRNCFR